MKLQIEDQRTIASVQKDFAEHFPFLKIEFFSKSHRAGKGTSKAYMRDTSLRISDCRSKHLNGELEIQPGMTVTELEQRLHDEFGLNVQVFRKSGKLWLETTATDSWTLGAQNTQGEELDHVNISSRRDEVDYHEQE
ncbi:MAG: hypothetical protein RL220_2061 [Bacteroidota bacterium]